MWGVFMCVVSIIVGNNAIGKSLFLKNKLVAGAVSNFTEDENSRIAPISEIKVHEMIKILKTDIDINNQELYFGKLYFGGKYSFVNDKFKNILTMMCKEGSILLLDEPDLHLSDSDITILSCVLENCNDKIFKEIWITTHEIGMLNIEGCRYYTLVDGCIVNIKKEEAYEYVN
jgi:Fe-S cluster assembly ATPase SufC